MKKIILLLILPIFGMTQINELVNKNGFKSFVFGDAPNNYKNLMLEIDENNTKLYSSPEENVKINGVELEFVRVTFLKNKLSAISVQTKNSTGSNLLNLLKQDYGEPSKINYSKKVYEWVLQGMKVIYEKNNTNKDAVISFYSKVNL
jgi:hypothetical protein